MLNSLKMLKRRFVGLSGLACAGLVIFGLGAHPALADHAAPGTCPVFDADDIDTCFSDWLDIVPDYDPILEPPDATQGQGKTMTA